MAIKNSFSDMVLDIIKVVAAIIIGYIIVNVIIQAIG